MPWGLKHFQPCAPGSRRFLTLTWVDAYCRDSQVTAQETGRHFTPEQEAQLSQIASHAGRDTERLVKEAALRLLEQDARFRVAVREGIAQADRDGCAHRVDA